MYSVEDPVLYYVPPKRISQSLFDAVDDEGGGAFENFRKIAKCTKL